MKVMVKDITELTYIVEVNDDSPNFVLDACNTLKYFAKNPVTKQNYQSFHVLPEDK